MQLYIHVWTFKCVLISLLEIKSFVYLKNDVCFFGRGYISRGKSGFPKFRGGLLIKGGLTDLEFFCGDLVKKGVRSADILEDTMTHHKIKPSAHLHQIYKTCSIYKQHLTRFPPYFFWPVSSDWTFCKTTTQKGIFAWIIMTFLRFLKYFLLISSQSIAKKNWKSHFQKEHLLK